MMMLANPVILICFKVSIHSFTGRLHGILKTGVRYESGLTAAGKDLVLKYLVIVMHSTFIVKIKTSCKLETQQEIPG